MWYTNFNWNIRVYITYSSLTLSLESLEVLVSAVYSDGVGGVLQFGYESLVCFSFIVVMQKSRKTTGLRIA